MRYIRESRNLVAQRAPTPSSCHGVGTLSRGKTVLVCSPTAHSSMSSAAAGGAASAETGAACTVVATSLLASADGGAGAAGSSAAEAPSPAEPAAAPSAPGAPGVDDTPSRGRPADIICHMAAALCRV